MRQLKLKLPNVKYKFDVVIQNDYSDSNYISDSFESKDAAFKYVDYLVKSGLEEERVQVQCGNRRVN